MKQIDIEKGLAKKFPNLLTYTPHSSDLFPGLRWNDSRMCVDLTSLDALNQIELAMREEDHDWFRTELWRAITEELPKPMSAESHKRATVHMYSAPAKYRLKAILKTMRIWES